MSGPAGAFTASARFLDVDSPPEQRWPASRIVAPNEADVQLEAANAYVVSVVVKCVATNPQKVKVQASVGGEDYCRQIACVKDSFQRIIHLIKRT